MSRSSAYSLAVVVFSSLLFACSRCHSGHYEVRHYNADTSVTCTSFDEDLECSTDYDPEHCSAVWVCDWTCEALDKGRQEAHPQHATLRQIKDTVDDRCTWDGVNARLK